MANEALSKERRDIPAVRPPADILEKDGSYYIVMDMPGVRKQELDISVEKKTLTVQGMTAYPKMEAEKILDNEFENVRYVRQFTLSDVVDKDRIQANLDNGVLKLHMPKVEQMQPKKIEIKAE